MGDCSPHGTVGPVVGVASSSYAVLDLGVCFEVERLADDVGAPPQVDPAYMLAQGTREFAAIFDGLRKRAVQVVKGEPIVTRTICRDQDSDADSKATAWAAMTLPRL